MNKNKKKILIIGQGAAASAIAKKLAQDEFIEKIFIAPSNGVESKFYQNIDIREDDITGLLKFVLDNEIDLTIPTSDKSIKSDIVTFFLENGQNIFGPTKNAAKIAINKAYGKKFLYKIRALTAKFGVFDKMQLAQDWLNNAKFPVIIRCAENNNAGDRLMCPTISLASDFLNSLLKRNEGEILAEEYTYGHNFTVYYITDGYSAIPITIVGNYKFAQDGEGGLLTNGTGCFAPNYKVSENILQKLGKIIDNTLNSLDKKQAPYIGILGVNCTLTDEETFVINEFHPFFQDFDASAILQLIEDDLIKIFYACIEGFFADEYEQISMKNLASISATVSARLQNKLISGLDRIEDIENIEFIGIHKLGDSYFSKQGEAFVLTRIASTLTRAKEYLYDDLAQINFDGMKVRNDICK